MVVKVNCDNRDEVLVGLAVVAYIKHLLELSNVKLGILDSEVEHIIWIRNSWLMWAYWKSVRVDVIIFPVGVSRFLNFCESFDPLLGDHFRLSCQLFHLCTGSHFKQLELLSLLFEVDLVFPIDIFLQSKQLGDFAQLFCKLAVFLFQYVAQVR